MYLVDPITEDDKSPVWLRQFQIEGEKEYDHYQVENRANAPQATWSALREDSLKKCFRDWHCHTRLDRCCIAIK